MSPRAMVAAIIAIAGCSGRSAPTPAPTPAPAPVTPVLADDAQPARIDTVFLIVMENTNWSEFHHNASAPYIGRLIATAAHADDYENVPGLHPSEPNYIWLEAGASLGIRSDADPAANHRDTPDHLTALLRAANIPWKAYLQGISGAECPLRSKGRYAAKHDPFVYFDDITGHLRADDPYCIAHLRPLDELGRDLADAATTPRYAFIVADLCHDMHDNCPPLDDRIAQGDRWLQGTVEMIEGSPAYQHGGAILITWDESEGGDRPIGLIAVSPFAKPHYFNRVKYDHSSTLETIEEILGVAPLLGDAGAPHTHDLADLFREGAF